MKEKAAKNISLAVVLIFALLFVAKFGGPAILRAYVESGIGNCQKMPLLCTVPEKEIINPAIDKAYLLELLPYEFPELKIYLPRGFRVTKEKITKVYYKKKKRKDKGAAIYLLYEKPNFFVGLFPRINRQGIKNNYDFLARIMYAKIDDIENFTDTFFVIMKSIFSPDIGDQKNIKMVKFTSGDKKGFITYNLGVSENYFDCNIMNSRDDFFKIYIKGGGLRLDLYKVLTIISTVSILK